MSHYYAWDRSLETIQSNIGQIASDQMVEKPQLKPEAAKFFAESQLDTMRRFLNIAEKMEDDAFKKGAVDLTVGWNLRIEISNDVIKGIESLIETIGG